MIFYRFCDRRLFEILRQWSIYSFIERRINLARKLFYTIIYQLIIDIGQLTSYKLQISWIKLSRCKSVKISTFVLAFLVLEYGLFIQLTHSLYNHPEWRNLGKLFSFKRFFWNVKFNQFKCRWTVYEWIKNFKYQIEVHDGFTLYLRANMFDEEIMFLLWKVQTLKCLIYFTASEIELCRELSAR